MEGKKNYEEMTVEERKNLIEKFKEYRDTAFEMLEPYVVDYYSAEIVKLEKLNELSVEKSIKNALESGITAEEIAKYDNANTREENDINR